MRPARYEHIRAAIDADRAWRVGHLLSGGVEGLLEALAGDSRAAVPQAARGGATTTEPACRAGVSIAAASRHAKVLREAGAIRSLRRGPPAPAARVDPGPAS